MLPPPTTSRLVRFGRYEVNLQTGELRKNHLSIRLQDQPFQILAILLEHQGEVVTRDELRRRLWPGNTFVDFDVGLNKAINKLRDTLCDSAERPHYIETLPRRGYRFIAPLETSGTTPSDPGVGRRLGLTPMASPESIPEEIKIISRGNHDSRRHEIRKRVLINLFVVGILVASASLLIWFELGRMPDRLAAALGIHPSSATPKIESIAVLPFQSFSADPERQYFADQMTEELITTLGRIHALRVVSRTSVMRFKGTRKPMPEIGRELDADAIVEGTVSRSGSRVHITTNLIYAPTDRHLWADSYESDTGDVLALQSEIARAIAGRIQIELAPREQARLVHWTPTDPEAEELYLKGRYHWSKRTEEDFEKGINCFSRAIERDEQFGRAYAGLADSYTLLARYEFLTPDKAYPKAKAAATRAVEIDDTSGEAHTSLAWAAFVFDWDWAVAEKEFVRANQLDPSYAQARHWHGLFLAAMGRFAEAENELRLAHGLDPLSLSITSSQGKVAYFRGDYDRALERFRETLALDPTFAEAHADLADAYEGMGMFREAVDQWQEALQISRSRRFKADLAHAYARSHHQDLARKLLRELIASPGRTPLPAVECAAMYVALGEKDNAFKWLERTYQERGSDMIFLRVDPAFVGLRSDPRFQALLRRMNFPL